MTRLEFRNRLCILRSIDRHELVEAGILAADDFTMWNTFVNDPVRWFLLCDDPTAQKLWALIERRSVDWDNNSDAYRALRAGILPPGCSMNANGALVIPDKERRTGPRGSSIVLNYFDEIVTASGEIVKSRSDAALKAARAL